MGCDNADNKKNPFSSCLFVFFHGHVWLGRPLSHVSQLSITTKTHICKHRYNKHMRWSTFDSSIERRCPFDFMPFMVPFVLVTFEANMTPRGDNGPWHTEHAWLCSNSSSNLTEPAIPRKVLLVFVPKLPFFCFSGSRILAVQQGKYKTFCLKQQYRKQGFVQIAQTSLLTTQGCTSLQQKVRSSSWNKLAT